MQALAVDSNLFEFYSFAAAALQLPCIRGEGFSYVSFSPSPWAQTVFDLDFTAHRVPISLMDGIRAGIIPNKVRLGPGSRPGDIEKRLAEAGFVPGSGTFGMSLELAGRPRPEHPRDLSLSLLKTGADFSVASELVVENLFGEKRDSGPAFARVLASLDRDRAFGILGSSEGLPVSTAFAFIDSAGIGGVYFVATEEGMRGRGYGAATVDAILGELELKGLASCILHATALGKPVYERLGFGALCPLAQYRLSPSN